MLRIGRAAALRPGHESAGVALAMTEQGAQSYSSNSQFNSQTRLRDLAARFARGLLSLGAP